MVALSQHGKSYFLLQNSDWQIFGLDSAYNSPAVLYTKGALNSEQIKYIQKYYDPGKKTIVMCHHNACDVTGKMIVMHDTQSLWGDVLNALGGNAPDYWYWGHIHDGVIYKPSTVKGKDYHTCCVGHSAMPYGAPWGLTKPGSMPPFGSSDNISTVEFFADTLMNSGVSVGQVKMASC